MSKRVGGIDWVQLSRTGVDPIVCPNYVKKFKNEDIEEAIKLEVGADELDIVYVPLDFCCLPMWPMEESQMTNAFEAIFVICVHCGKVCRSGAQVCMQFFIPHRIKKGKTNKWSWLPRIRCQRCTIETKQRRNLVLMPYVIYTHKLLSLVLDQFISKVNKVVQTTSFCHMCDRPLSSKSHRLCKSAKCRQMHRLMRSIQKECNPFDDGSNYGLFQLLDFLQMIGQERMDVNKALCNVEMCHRYTSGCRRKGNRHVLCTRCHRVAYCSKKCRTKDKKHICYSDWNRVFHSENIVVMKD